MRLLLALGSAAANSNSEVSGPTLPQQPQLLLKKGGEGAGVLRHRPRRSSRTYSTKTATAVPLHIRSEASRSPVGCWGSPQQ